MRRVTLAYSFSRLQMPVCELNVRCSHVTQIETAGSPREELKSHVAFAFILHSVVTLLEVQTSSFVSVRRLPRRRFHM